MTDAATIQQNDICAPMIHSAETRMFGVVVFLPLTLMCVIAYVITFRQAHWLLAILFLWPLLLPVALRNRPTAFTAALGVLIPVEILCAILANYTVIGLGMFLWMMFVWANVVPVGSYFLRQGDFISWLLMIGIAAAVIPGQLFLGARLLKLHAESSRIIAYAYDYKLKNDRFPTDLSGYRFKFTSVSNNVRFYGSGTNDKFTYPFKDSPHYDRGDKFSLRYHVGDRHTAYWFSSKKGWFIEDD